MSIQNAARYALRPAIRTTAQTAAAMLGSIAIISLADIAAMSTTLAVMVTSSILAGVVSFLQNFAEQLAEGGE